MDKTKPVKIPVAKLKKSTNFCIKPWIIAKIIATDIPIKKFLNLPFSSERITKRIKDARKNKILPARNSIIALTLTYSYTKIAPFS